MKQWLPVVLVPGALSVDGTAGHWLRGAFARGMVDGVRGKPLVLDEAVDRPYRK